MSTRVESVSPADTACSMGSPCFLEGSDLLYDHHSSEEELEVINNSQKELFLPYSASPSDLYINQISPLSNPTPNPVSESPICTKSPQQLYEEEDHQDQEKQSRIIHLSTNRSNSTSTLPEKRKWSQIENKTNSTHSCQVVMQIDYDRITSPELPNSEEINKINNKFISSYKSDMLKSNDFAKFSLSTCDDIRSNQENIENNENQSSDDEVHHFLDSNFSTPVQFRTSPPLEALKPHRNSVGIINGLPGLSTAASVPGGLIATGLKRESPVVLMEHSARNEFNEWTCDAPMEVRSLSPPTKVFHCSVSPRRRSARSSGSHQNRTHRNLHRPCLDFDKMQQLKARSVTSWRHNGEHGGELSVFCW